MSDRYSVLRYIDLTGYREVNMAQPVDATLSSARNSVLPDGATHLVGSVVLLPDIGTPSD
jgi:hypothetical protein